MRYRKAVPVFANVNVLKLRIIVKSPSNITCTDFLHRWYILVKCYLLNQILRVIKRVQRVHLFYYNNLYCYIYIYLRTFIYRPSIVKIIFIGWNKRDREFDNRRNDAFTRVVSVSCVCVSRWLRGFHLRASLSSVDETKSTKLANISKDVPLCNDNVGQCTSPPCTFAHFVQSVPRGTRNKCSS